MQNVFKLVGVLVVLLVLVFGYFLQRSNWDFTLAKGMIGYEIGQLMGDKRTPVTVNATGADDQRVDAQPVDNQTPSDATATPSQPAHGKDSIYRDKGNSFSDMKRTGNESNYQPKHKH